MTKAEFYGRLSKKDCKWRLAKEGKIRTVEEHDGWLECPLTHVASVLHSNEPFRLYDDFVAGERLGLSYHDTREIRDAADNKEGCSEEVRGKLLEACGLLPRDLS